jgi:transcriptional regulator with XRE-family HTH domain
MNGQRRRNGLGPLIKRKRIELALTQRELAKQIGVEASHVAYLENGKRNPSLTLMARLEAALGVSRRQIFLLSHPEAAGVVNQSDAVGVRESPADGWRRFMRDRSFVQRHRITRRELRALKELNLLGYVLSRHQVLAILTMIREPQED